MNGLSGTSRHLIAPSGFHSLLVALFEDLTNSSPSALSFIFVYPAAS